MMADDESRVRQLAYRIWESEGRPDDQQQRHWDMAMNIVAAEQAAGQEASLEEEGEAKEEVPILDDELPLEDDERGIEENRLPLEDPDADSMLDPDGDPTLEEVPYRDDTLITQELPVQDRAEPTEEPLDNTVELDEPSADSEVEIRRVPRQRSAGQRTGNEGVASKSTVDKEPAEKASKSDAKKTTARKTTTRSRKT